MAGHGEEKLSQYELDRLDNMRRNASVLADLGLGPGGEARILPPPSANKPAKRKRDPSRRPPPRDPERRSSRLEGRAAPDYYISGEDARGNVTLGGDDVERAKAWMRSRLFGEAAGGSLMTPFDPMVHFRQGGMPTNPEQLIAGEMKAFNALRLAKSEKAREEGIEGYKVAPLQALCEMVRRTPESADELLECWGFAEKRVAAYGEYFLHALRKHIPAVRAAHEEARRAPEEEEDVPLADRRRMRHAAAAEARRAEDATTAPPQPRRSRRLIASPL